MKATKKLYDNEPYGQTFTATILSAEKENSSWKIVLDQTLFFPEEGGQSADKGTLSGWIVEDVQIRDDVIYHKVRTPMLAIPKAGMTVQGQIDWAHRFSNMQNHTGEHILSGLIHAKYGFENVGFHLSDNIITFDQSGYLTPEQVAGIEREANRVVWANLPVTAVYVSPAEAAKKTYRSKIAIEGDVRLVTIGSAGEDSPACCSDAGDGQEKEQCFGVVDVCACCAPHVAHTGEVGLIKILRSEKYKGGTRLTILCGKRALEEVCKRQNQIETISHLLRAKQDEADEAVQHLFEENAAQKERLIRMQEEKIQSLAEQADFSGENVWIFTEGLDPLPHRNLVNLLMERCEGYAGVFLQTDDAGYRFIIGSRTKDSREAARILRESFGAKGGGKPEMVQGSIKACRDEIAELFRKDIS